MIYILITLGVIFVAVVIGLVFYLAKSLGQSNGTFKNLKEYNNKQIGNEGERKVNLVLSKLHGYLYSPYKIANKNGKIREIDHVFVNNTGVYIIETKKRVGKITGSDSDEHWYQHLDNGEINIMPNAIYQNEGHYRLLDAVLPKDAVLIPMVVMVENNSSTINSEGVIDLRDLEDEIENAPVVMSEEQVNKVVKFLNDKQCNVSNEYIRNQNINEHKNKS